MCFSDRDNGWLGLKQLGVSRAGFGFSDTGISGFLLGHFSDRREEVHEEAKA